MVLPTLAIAVLLFASGSNGQYGGRPNSGGFQQGQPSGQSSFSTQQQFDNNGAGSNFQVGVPQTSGIWGASTNQQTQFNGGGSNGLNRGGSGSSGTGFSQQFQQPSTGQFGQVFRQQSGGSNFGSGSSWSSGSSQPGSSFGQQTGGSRFGTGGWSTNGNQQSQFSQPNSGFGQRNSNFGSQQARPSTIMQQLQFGQTSFGQQMGSFGGNRRSSQSSFSQSSNSRGGY